MPKRRINGATFERRLRAIQERIAKERDALRELLSEAEDLADAADSAIENIEIAVDRIRELV